MRLQPMDILAHGTIVTIGNKKGEVVNHEICDAYPSGKIVVHTVELTHKWKVLSCNRGKWEKLDKPQIWKGNYSAISY